MLAATLGKMFNSRKEDSSERLVKLLNKNKEKITISKDGLVSTNFDHEDVIKEVKRQLELLAGIEVEKNKDNR